MSEPMAGRLSLNYIKSLVDDDMKHLPELEKDRLGNCFEYAELFGANNFVALKFTDCTIVHGYYYTRSVIGDRGKIAHAWVEFGEYNHLYDPVFATFAEKSPRYESVYEYSVPEVRANFLKHETHGPWEKLADYHIIPADVDLPFDF